ncbi:MAG: hypothetical protein K1X53_02195 [Candidatus Sumerlaeaceae bacterium]|nr:hypothetical protein [Candidatus Sumerlaeaceae bacterium]
MRRNFKSSVPPIFLRADSTSQILTLWHKTSGIDFYYDADFLSGMALRAGRCLDALERIPIKTEMYGPPTTPFYADFLVPKPVSTPQFMNLLALQFGGSAWKESDNWHIGRFRRDTAGVSTIHELLSQIRDRPYKHGYGLPEQHLKMIGLQAQPEILQEFATATDYFENSLAVVLAAVPSAERDEVFLKKLASRVKDKDRRFLSHWFLPTMLRALADNGNRAVLPYARQLLTAARTDGDTRVNCRIVLNMFGEDISHRSAEAFLKLADSASTEVEQANVKAALPVLHAVLDQAFFDSTAPLLLKRARTNEKGHVEFTGRFLAHQGGWGIEIHCLTETEAIVETGFARAELWGGGYFAILRKRNDQWLLFDWIQLSVS